MTLLINMKHTTAISSALLLAFCACSSLIQSALAQPISGNITFAGSVQLDSPSAGTATAVSAWHGLGPGDMPQVESVDGNFASFVAAGDSTLFHAPWSFDSGAISSFWSVDGFTFDLISSAIHLPRGSDSVSVSGTGTISGHGFTPTLGSWNFTTQDPSAASEFSFSAATGVPESGSTILLLAISAVALTGGKLFFRKPAAG
jgi:hypothetical protein